jgi:hypothetical protein
MWISTDNDRDTNTLVLAVVVTVGLVPNIYDCRFWYLWATSSAKKCLNDVKVQSLLGFNAGIHHKGSPRTAITYAWAKIAYKWRWFKSTF